ncbi:hypothetical protein WKT22_03604 [Candidatus Lokiarchaeum ossiferum]
MSKNSKKEGNNGGFLESVTEVIKLDCEIHPSMKNWREKNDLYIFYEKSIFYPFI